MSASRLQADYLTCSRCSQPFSQPKTLPCLHNFCKHCLSDYLEQEMSGGRHTSFDCPQCRKKIFVPDASKPVNMWAAQFPTNFMLSGMIEAIAKETSGHGGGVALVKAARERRGVADLQEAPAGSPQVSKGRRGQLQKVSSGEGVDTKVNDMQVKMTLLKTHLDKENKELTAHKAQLRQDQDEEKHRLEQSFHKVFQLINGRKAQLLEELANSFGEEEEKIDQMQQGLQNDFESLKSCSELLKSLENKPLSDSVALEMLEAIRAQTSEIDARSSRISGRRVKFEQTLEAGRSILKLVDSLGSITISTTGDLTFDGAASGGGASMGTRHNDADDGGPRKETRILNKPKFLTALSTRQDNGKCQQIYDIAVMSSGVIVMTAYGENVIQAAKPVENTFKVFSRLQLDSEPKSVTVISPYYIGVVSTSCVYLVAVTDTLTLKQRVNTGKDYSGISTYSESSLVLLSRNPPSIDFVGLNGFISETIDRDRTTGSLLLKLPQFITTSNDGVIYVTDASRVPRLLSVNNAGKVRFQYPPEGGSSTLQAPQGVCCDSEGHVYIVDRGARTVVLLTKNGEKIKDILTSEDGITDPCGIAVDAKGNIYVTNDFSEILVFQIKQ